MDYLEWAREYQQNAQRVKTVIERRYRQLKGEGLTADSRKRLNDELQAYRKIYYELTRTCDLLTERAKAVSDDA